MNEKRIVAYSACVGVLLLVIGFWPANGQQGSPSESTGQTRDVLAGIDLGAEIDGMDGRRLRMNRITTEPGGKGVLHSHNNRPYVMHVLQGTVTIHSEDGSTKEVKAGESNYGGEGITHWAENKGTVDSIVIVVDIFSME